MYSIYTEMKTDSARNDDDDNGYVRQNIRQISREVLSNVQCEFNGHSGQCQQCHKTHYSLKCHQSLGQTQNPKNLIGNPIPPEALSEVV